MGLFLTMAGVAGSSATEVRAALAKFARNRGTRMEPKAATPGDDDAILVLSSNGNVHTILWAWKECSEVQELSEFLSRELSGPVLWLHIHDGDFWMYQLFVDGVAVDAFNPIPKYWNDDAPEDETRQWRGDAKIVAKHRPDVIPESISRYLNEWDLDANNPGKAYPDDVYPMGSEWQLLDFMRKLGMEYPIKGTNRSFKGDPTPAARQSSPETASANNVAFRGETFLFR